MIAAHSKIYQNTNPIFELTIKDQNFNLVNLKNATKHNFLVLKPSGKIETWIATVTGTNFEILSYTPFSWPEVLYVPATYNPDGSILTPAQCPVPAHTDLDEVGFYTISPEIELSALKVIGESFQIQVHKFGL